MLLGLPRLLRLHVTDVLQRVLMEATSLLEWHMLAELKLEKVAWFAITTRRARRERCRRTEKRELVVSRMQADYGQLGHAEVVVMTVSLGPFMSLQFWDCMSCDSLPQRFDKARS